MTIKMIDSLLNIMQGINGLVYIIDAIAYFEKDFSPIIEEQDIKALNLVSQQLGQYADELKPIHAALREQYEKETKEKGDHLAKEQEQQCTRVPV